MRVLAIVQQDDAGPGVFAEAIRARGGHARGLAPGGGAAPAPVRPRRGDRCSAARWTPTTRPRHPWLRRREGAPRARCSGRGVPVLGVCLGAQLLAEAAGGYGAPGGRARRSAGTRSRLEPGAGDDPVHRAACPRSFSSFQWHSYEAVPPAGRGGARAQRRAACRRSGSTGVPRGASSSTPRWTPRRRGLDRGATAATPTPCGWASTPTRCAPRRRRGWRRGTSSAAGCAGASWTRPATGLLGSEVGAREAAVDQEGRWR